jgi:signal transduction histidine kinase
MDDGSPLLHTPSRRVERHRRRGWRTFRQLRSLRQFLALLVLVAVAPIAVVAAGLLMAQARSETRTLERALSVNAHTLSLAIDREMANYETLLTTLAIAPHLQRGDYAGFHAYAQQVANKYQAAFISLFSPDGRQLLNSSQPYGAPVLSPAELPDPGPDLKEPPHGDGTALRKALREGVRTNSNLFRSRSLGRIVFAVNHPVMRDGKLAYVLNVGIDPAVFRDLLTRPSSGPSPLIVVVDGNNLLVGRWDGRADLVGSPARPEYRKARAGGGSFIARTTTREGEPAIYAAHTSPVTGWTAIYGLRTAQAAAVTQSIWVIGAIAVALSLVLGGWLAYRYATQITRSLRLLTDAAAGKTSVYSEAAIPEFAAVHAALLRASAADSIAALEREKHVVARTRQEELEEASRAKDQFIRTLSHELRNPLGAIRNATLLLRRGVPPEMPLAIVERQTAQLVRLVDDLMDVSRLSMGKLSLKKERLDLRVSIAESVEGVQHRLTQKRQLVEIQQPDEALEVVADASRIKQVLTNLLDNASKYSPPDTQLQVTLSRSGDVARITVRDEGPGVDAADLERVFEPFVQLTAQRSEQTEGLGLGLPIARHLIQQHGGDITMASAGAGKGSVVTVELPLALGAHDLAAAAA